jgi:CDP-diglyceride synthetase
MHLSLGNTQRGILAGWVTAVILALLSGWNGDVTWHQAVGAAVLASVAPIGALIDPGSKPPKS